MSKLKKTALKSGIDTDGTQLFYSCDKCGAVNYLNDKKCPLCKKKRRSDAYEQAMQSAKRPRTQQEQYYVDRTARACAPAPVSTAFAVPLPTDPAFDSATYTNNRLAGLPEYFSTDEYGRVYKARVTYRSLPCAGPVPVPAPSEVVQTTAINVPINHHYQQ